MSKASSFLSSLQEERSIRIALHDPGTSFYRNAVVLYFELWDVPSTDPVLNDRREAKSYVGLFQNMQVIHKRKVLKYNSTKQRIGLERDRFSRIFIPDSVWKKVHILEPREDQKIFMQCVYLLYEKYGVRILGMEDMYKIRLMQD